MNINDYLIEQPGKNWGRFLHDWMPPLPSKFTLWLVNRLGDAFIVAEDRTILRLHVGFGTCSEVAKTREHFAQLVQIPRYADEWLRISLINACRRVGMLLTDDQCYGFKLPPTLGGQYEPANLIPTRLAVHYSYQAYICKQTDVYWIPPS
jgi:hypothetical protein